MELRFRDFFIVDGRLRSHESLTLRTFSVRGTEANDDHQKENCISKKNYLMMNHQQWLVFADGVMVLDNSVFDMVEGIKKVADHLRSPHPPSFMTR
jgi:hypothetical protein